jgi:HAE1 family hydrophobic/amphiphilic exporter-1
MASSVATPLGVQFGRSWPHPDDVGERTRLRQITSVRFEPPNRWTVRDTLSAINAAAAQLPVGLPYRRDRKVNPADTPILLLSATSETLPLTTVDAYAENILLQKISQISGVGLVGIGGQQKPAIRVQLDPQALAARGINLEDARTALGQANVDLPKGTLNSPRQTYTLNTNDYTIAIN